MRGVHVFRAGEHIASGGETIRVSPDELAGTVASYDPKRHEAPVVIGHPRTNHPAFAWVSRLEAKGPDLFADFRDVEPAFADLVAAGRYKKVSVSFFTPTGKTNPKPGVWSLRHVGFLGAVPPAVKGLEGVRFAEAEEAVVTFADGLGTEDLAERERRLVRRENEGMVDAAIREGRLTPGLRPLVLGLMESLDGDAVVSLADGDGTTETDQATAFRSLIAALPKFVELGELSRLTGEDDAGEDRFSGADGMEVDGRGLELHRAALTYQKAHKVDYRTAVLAVVERRS